MSAWFSRFLAAAAGPFRVQPTDIVSNPRDARPGIQTLAGLVRSAGEQLGDIYPGESGIRFPQVTTAQRDTFTPQAGEVIWNLDTIRLEVFDGTAWAPLWEPAEGASVGVSTKWPAGTAVATGGGTAPFELPLPAPATFVSVNRLEFEVSNISPGPGISTFDVALYDTEANRDAGTFNSADPGIQFLAPALTQAAPGGPVTVPWSVLGAIQGSLDGSGDPVLWGLVRNNDVANVFDGTVALEAYGLRGSRAL